MNINLQNMRRLRAHLRSRNNLVGFEMQNYFCHNGRKLVSSAAICRAAKEHPCGTVACLAGHAVWMAWESGNMPRRQKANIHNVAAEWLGLNRSEAIDLFLGHWNNKDRMCALADLTKAQAITELTRLIDAET